MTRNYQLWRANIRRSYERGYSNRRNRGAWSNPNAGYAMTSTYVFGGWRHFGASTSLTFKITESYTEQQNTDLTYVGSPPANLTKNWAFARIVDVAVPGDRVNLLTSLTLPPNADGEALVDMEARAYHHHASATPYGEGLYNCQGTWVIYAATQLIEDYTDNVPFILDYHYDNTAMASYRFDYNTFGQTIKGLRTKSRWEAGQGFHGPSIAFNPNVTLITDNPGYLTDEFAYEDIPFLPAETNPDGEPGIEMYWTDTALRCLVDGEFSDEVDVLSGTASRSVPSYDDTDTLPSSSWSHSWARSGTITLKFFHSSSPPPP